MELTIDCVKRDSKAKAKALRRDGLLPVVLYGHDGANSVSLTAKGRDVEALLRRASENNTLINVQVPDMPWNGKALIREVQKHPWKNLVYHLSFYAVAASDAVEVTVPLNYVGEAKGVKIEGGLLNTEINEVAVKCEAGSIPESIDVDVSELGIGASLALGDLKLPSGVSLTGDPNQSIVTVLATRKSVTDAAGGKDGEN